MTVTQNDIAHRAAQVVAANRLAQRMLVTAESCTGGMVAAALTDIPGSSAVVWGGFVTYANAAKVTALGVDPDIMANSGAVSVNTARAMAHGALRHSDADVAVAISGVAGPGGGSPDKPVGTVVFAVAERGQQLADIYAETVHFSSDGSRKTIRRQATLRALELLLPSTVP
jgi:nicotinamide-nucleotide amidase